MRILADLRSGRDESRRIQRRFVNHFSIKTAGAFLGDLAIGHRWCDYSFHDFNLSSVLLALDADVKQPKPNFLGAIFFELHKDPLVGKRESY